MTPEEFMAAGKPADKPAGRLSPDEFMAARPARAAPAAAAPARRLSPDEFMAHPGPSEHPRAPAVEHRPTPSSSNRYGLDPTHLQRMRSLLHTITGKDISPGDPGDPLVAVEGLLDTVSHINANNIAHGVHNFFVPTGPDRDVNYKKGLGSLEVATRLAQAENEAEKESILKHHYGDKNVGRDSKGGLYVVEKGKKVAAHPKTIQGLVGGLTGTAPETVLSMLGTVGGGALGTAGGPADEITVPLMATAGAGTGGALGHAIQEGAKALLGDYHQSPKELARNLAQAAIWNAGPEGAFRAVGSAVSHTPQLAKEMIPRDPVGGHLMAAPAVTAPDTHLPIHRFAEQLGDRLYQIHNQGQVDKTIAEEMFNSLPKDATNADFEAITHFIENPKHEKLTPKQRALYDKYIVPLRVANKRAYEAIKEMNGESSVALPKRVKTVKGVEVGPGDIGHSHREAKAKGGFFDRFLGLGQASPTPVGLRTGASSLKRRKLYALVGPDGERKVAHLDKGRISVWTPSTGWSQEGHYGRLPKLGDALPVGGVAHTVTDATTKEIEASGAANYYKHALATHVLDWAQLNAAERNVRFLNDLKPQMEEAGMATRDDMEAQEKGFIPTKLPQFTGWKMEPHVADVLDDLHKRINPKEGDWFLEGAEKLNDFFVRTIVFNPVFHTMNMGAQWAISRGATGWLSPGGHVSAFNTLLKAQREVLRQGPIWKSMMDHGAAFQAARRENGEMASKLAMLQAGDIAKNPSKWENYAKKLGFASPLHLMHGIWRGAEKAMWSGGDILEMSRIMELQNRGYSLEDAIKRAERTIVNYRVPARVLGSRFLKDRVLSSEAFLFNSYHYGILNAYANMVSDLARPSAPMAERLEAMDQMAALGLIMTKVLPTLDAAAQQFSGQDNARFPRPGMTKFSSDISQFVKGEKPWEQLPGTLFTPAVGTDFLYKVLYNKDPFTGKRLVDYNDGPAGAAQDMAFAVLDQIGVGPSIEKVLSGKSTPAAGLLTQGVGVQFPNEEGRAYVRGKNAHEDARRHAEQDEQKKAAARATKKLLKTLGLAH